MGTVLELEATEELNQTLEKATEEEAESSNAKGTTTGVVKIQCFERSFANK